MIMAVGALAVGALASQTDALTTCGGQHGYVGNEKALLHEITPLKAEGALRDFLYKVAAKQSQHAQLEKFTTKHADGTRRFVHGESTRLYPVEPEVEEALRADWHASGYVSHSFTVLQSSSPTTAISHTRQHSFIEGLWLSGGLGMGAASRAQRLAACGLCCKRPRHLWSSGLH